MRHRIRGLDKWVTASPDIALLPPPISLNITQGERSLCFLSNRFSSRSTQRSWNNPIRTASSYYLVVFWGSSSLKLNQVKFTETSVPAPRAHFLAKVRGGEEAQDLSQHAAAPTMTQWEAIFLAWCTWPWTRPSSVGLYLSGVSQNYPLLGEESTADYCHYFLLEDPHRYTP